MAGDTAMVAGANGAAAAAPHGVCRRLPGLPAFFGCPDLADAEAVVVVAPPGGAGGGGERVAARLPVHRLVVAAASPYFAALFSRWPCARHAGAGVGGATKPLQESDGDGDDDSSCRCRRIELRVAHDDDVAAAVALLRCCYTGVFDAALAAGAGDDADSVREAPGRCWQQLAVRTLVLADRLGCAGAADACVEALSGRLFAHQMSLDAALAALCLLPEPLARQPAIAPLQRMAGVRVEQEFARLEPALADGARVERFQALPAAAAAALLASDELRVWSEGAVLAGERRLIVFFIC